MPLSSASPELRHTVGLCLTPMFYGVCAMHGSASAGATASSLATSEIGTYINLHANGFGLPRIVIDQPGMSDEVSDQSLQFVVGPLVVNIKLSTDIFDAVGYVDAVLCQVIGPS